MNPPAQKRRRSSRVDSVTTSSSEGPGDNCSSVENPIIKEENNSEEIKVSKEVTENKSIPLTSATATDVGDTKPSANPDHGPSPASSTIPETNTTNTELGETKIDPSVARVAASLGNTSDDSAQTSFNTKGGKQSPGTNEANRSRYDKAWNTMYQNLVEYKDKHGDCLIPFEWKESPELGRWVVRQRHCKRNNNLSSERIDALDKIGFSWSVGGETLEWNDMYERLVQFKAKHDHCLVPNRYKDDTQLGTWVSTQRQKYDSLSEDRKKRLNDIGFVWVARDTVPWNAMYDRLLKYKEQSGDCRVPSGYKTDPQLARWVHYQRQNEEKISKEKKEKLDSINFVWSGETKKQGDAWWDEMYGRLLKYREKHGDCKVPQTYHDDLQLARWVSKQRFDNHNLKDDRKKKLDEIGFEWSVQETWEHMYEQLVEFKTKNGHFVIPRKGHVKLARWVCNQRARRDNLSAEREAKLNSIGFVWKVRKRKPTAKKKKGDNGPSTINATTKSSEEERHQETQHQQQSISPTNTADTTPSLTATSTVEPDDIKIGISASAISTTENPNMVQPILHDENGTVHTTTTTLIHGVAAAATDPVTAAAAAAVTAAAAVAAAEVLQADPIINGNGHIANGHHQQQSLQFNNGSVGLNSSVPLLPLPQPTQTQPPPTAAQVPETVPQAPLAPPPPQQQEQQQPPQEAQATSPQTQQQPSQSSPTHPNLDEVWDEVAL